MASLAEKFLKPSSVETVELLAARRVIILVQELGFENSIFEGDSKTIINSLQNSDQLKSFIGHLVPDTLSFVNSLRSWLFSHIGRQGNTITHALTRRARLSSPLDVWMESVPPNILHVLSVDFPIFQ